jgi:UDP-N-acetylmuramate--alanine ligase
MIPFKIQMSAKEIELKPGMHVHLVGIGGAGLSAIARVLLGKGFTVSGSDLQMNELTNDLSSAGIDIFEGHDPRFSRDADVLLVSSAIPENNVEVLAARDSGIPVLKRAEFLDRFLVGAYVIAIAGTHGKTTTTGMISQIMIEADLDPSIIVGGTLPAIGSNGRAGQSVYFVIEADEYDQMFLGLKPDVAVITNVDYDHPDLYPSEKDYQRIFEEFLKNIKEGGRLVICRDDPLANRLAREAPDPHIEIETYGLTKADWRAVDLRVNQLGGIDFVVQRDRESVSLIRLRVPGQHNVLNALAAVATTAGLGIEMSTILQALANFGGVGRRFQIVGDVGGVTIIDDYAHHPTEIRATLAAARQRYPGRRIWAVWQPHTFSRTKSLLPEFATSFSEADRVLILEVFQSRETDNLGLNMNVIMKAMDHPDVSHIGSIVATADFFLERVRPGDVFLTLSAGDGNLVGEIVFHYLQKRLEYGPQMNNGQG